MLFNEHSEKQKGFLRSFHMDAPFSLLSYVCNRATELRIMR